MNDLLACLFVFVEVWLTFLGLTLLTVAVFDAAWMRLEGMQS